MNSHSKHSRVVLCLASIICLQCASRESPADDTIEFEPVPGFVQLPKGMELGQCSAVAVGNTGDIYLFHRGKHPIVCLNSKGQYLRSWGDNLFGTPHGLRIDKAGNVWVTDASRHRVYKFDPNGKVLLTLGTGEPGTAADQFDRPTDIAWDTRGNIFVADGYGNSRVMKFSPTGRFITTWGRRGTKPGEFHLPHSIVIDAQGRIIVGDRENNRVQVFDGDGKLLAVHSGFAPYGLALDPKGRLFVADGRAAKILRIGENGKVEQSWGGLGTAPGKFKMPHMLTLDATGNLFVAEVNGMRLQKLQRVVAREK